VDNELAPPDVDDCWFTLKARAAEEAPDLMLTLSWSITLKGWEFLLDVAPYKPCKAS